MLLDIVNKILAILTILSQIFILLAIFYYLFLRKKYPSVLDFFVKNRLKLAFIVALTATLGSLFYSEVAGFNPCKLCWFQRIFMYPEALILGFALFKKDIKIISYSILLASIGWIISVYHNFTFYKAVPQLVCKIGESCTTPYVVEFGYITIPIMALTAFSLIISLLWIWKN